MIVRMRIPRPDLAIALGAAEARHRAFQWRSWTGSSDLRTMPTPPPPFDLDLLRTFVAIVDNGGFTRAAERVGRTQSTVSLQIKKLEDGLGRGARPRLRLGVADDGEGAHGRNPYHPGRV